MSASRVPLVSGQVVDAAGAAVAGARVMFSASPGPLADVAALTGADGRFSLAAPWPGRYVVEAVSDAHGQAKQVLSVSQAEVSVRLQLPR